MNALRSISMLTLLSGRQRRDYARRLAVSTEKAGLQPNVTRVRLSRYSDSLGMTRSPELLHGTLDTLVLKTLAGGRRHGYAIARTIEDATDGVVEIEEGSLYPALY